MSGYVRSAATGEDIIGSSVFVQETMQGASTNVYGFYSLTLPSGEYTLSATSIGYKNFSRKISLNEDLTLNIELESQVITGKTAVIVGEKNQNIESTNVGRENIEVAKIKSLPALLGEVDVLKTIQLLPGIQSAGEGNAGFFVRGGGADQNLILLDNAIVYNASHLFGFFSVFNADAIKDLEIIKGGMPAEYGGRVSSVLDINMYEGNKKEFKAKGGIGLISSRLMLEGPIVKDKSSFTVSARRTYADLILRPLQRNSVNRIGYYFYDANLKANYRLSDKDQFYLSAYLGKDVFNFDSDETGFNISSPWGNSTLAARWNHLFNDKLFMNTTGTFTQYDFEFGIDQSDFVFNLSSAIRDWSLKTQLSYFPSLRHNIKAGADYIYHRFTPNTIEARSGDVEFDVGNGENIYSHEGAFYLQDDFDLTERIRIHAGLRFSWFAHIGPYTKYTLFESEDDLAPDPEPEIEKFERGQILKTYVNPEPRFNIRIGTGPKSSVKASYTHNYQYVHLTSTSASSLPTDIWFPSTDRVQPQFGRQASVGYFRNFKESRYQGSLELYYKWLENLIEFKPGFQPEDNVNNNIDNNLVFGTGYSYGAEFMLKKVKGDVSGWIAYTLSKTMREFEEISDEPYPSKFDRRHDVAITLNWKINDAWRLGSAFVYASGNNITIPVSRYFIEGRIIEEYGERNAFRMPAYHRLDLSATYYPQRNKKVTNKSGDELKAIEQEQKAKRKFESHWNFSVYNLYNRQNPYFIYFDNTGNLQEGQLDIAAIQVSLFPIIPSISWNFEF